MLLSISFGSMDNLHTDDYTSLPLRPGDLLVSVWAEDLLTAMSPLSDVQDSVTFVLFSLLYYKETSVGLFHR